MPPQVLRRQSATLMNRSQSLRREAEEARARCAEMMRRARETIRVTRLVAELRMVTFVIFGMSPAPRDLAGRCSVLVSMCWLLLSAEVEVHCGGNDEG